VTDPQAVLAASVARLRALVESLGPDQLRASAYPTEWTVADALSHIGSSAVIAVMRVDTALHGGEVDPQPVWDEWDAKDADAKAADGLAADQAFLQRVEALSDEERSTIAISLGPMTLDLPAHLRFRAAEHVLHVWDIAVAFDPRATLAPDGVETVLEMLPMIARFSGKPTGATRALRIRTTEPARVFVVSVTPDGVSLEPDNADADAALELPAEALARLVYGRLDPDHTPAFVGSEADLDELRRVFQGV
jgi:uncharacterized protein (TIGR03083 family)